MSDMKQLAERLSRACPERFLFIESGECWVVWDRTHEDRYILDLPGRIASIAETRTFWWGVCAGLLAEFFHSIGGIEDVATQVVAHFEAAAEEKK